MDVGKMGVHCKDDLKLGCCGNEGEVDGFKGRKDKSVGVGETAWILGMRWEGRMGSGKKMTWFEARYMVLPFRRALA